MYITYGVFLPVCFQIDGLARNHRSSIADALELRGPALNHGYTVYYALECVCMCVFVCFYWYCILVPYIYFIVGQ